MVPAGRSTHVDHRFGWDVGDWKRSPRFYTTRSARPHWLALRCQADDVEMDTGLPLVRRANFHLRATTNIRCIEGRSSCLKMARRSSNEPSTRPLPGFARVWPVARPGLRRAGMTCGTVCACRRLLLWCRQPARLDNRIVYLPRYVGHRQVAFT